jgi:diguanylate cyclase (GGDEF)-like protein
VLAVDVTSVGIAVITVHAATIDRSRWSWFVFLAVAAILHLEAARGIERRRDRAVEGAPQMNLDSLWVCAAWLLVPMPLVIALIVLCYGYCWLRVYDHPVLHRKVFSAATFVLASAAAVGVLHAGGLGATPRIPADARSLLVVLAAAVVWWLVNYVLIVAAIAMSAPELPIRRAMGDLADQAVVAASLGLGIAVGTLMVDRPWVVPVLMVTALCLHRDLLLPQLRRAVRSDAKTGLASPAFWADVLATELRRARPAASGVGVLMLDLDHFADINSLHGHPAGDQALRAVAGTVRGAVRRQDLVARWGGDELAVVLPDVNPDELKAVAERIRALLARTPISLTSTTTGFPHMLTGLTISVGAALAPAAGADAEALVTAADSALYAAKNAGRNQVRMAVGNGHR